MFLKKINKFHSIFSKIIILNIITLSIIIFFFFYFISPWSNLQFKELINDNIKNYYSYIAIELGSPPDTSKAIKISDDFSIIIKYESDSLNWSSMKQQEAEQIKNLHDLRFGDDEIEIANKDGSKFTFRGNFRNILVPENLHKFRMITILFCIFLLSYLVLRWLLKPIKILDRGVSRVKTGNFNEEVNVYHNDELGNLAESFNEMTKNIANMIKSKDQFLLDVSHELRSPLTRIKVALEFLKDESTKEKISDDVKEIEIMINGILETERLNSSFGGLRVTETDLIQIVKEIVEKNKDIKSGIKLSVPNQPIKLHIDADRIIICLNNIITNGLKFSDHQKKSLEISVIKNRDCVEISVKDYGIGIPENELKNIFEPFYKVDKSRVKNKSGFGLGLNLCKKIIDLHNGKISIMQNTEKGVTVKISLPTA